MKQLFILSLVLACSPSSLYAQTKTIKGRVIDEYFRAMPYMPIMVNDTVKAGRTDLDGFFQIDVPISVRNLFFNDVGMESASIALADTCAAVEVVMLLRGTHDFITLKKVDKRRRKEFKKLLELHKAAFEKGLFKADKVCYTQAFMPDYKNKQK